MKDSKTPIISIIVPVYNVEKYLEKCIESILRQTFIDFELLLIDDGSTDNSGKICDEYSLKDKRIKVIHKENGGLSDARNSGLNIALGDYIGFVDSDDWIESDMYEVLYNNLKKYNADISICKMRMIKYDNYDSINNQTNNCILLNNKEAFECLFNTKYFASHACDKLYKKELIKNIRYPKGKLYEDMFTTYQVFEKTNKVVFTDYIGYNYYQRIDGIVNSKFTIQKLDYIEAFNDIFNLCRKKYPQTEKTVKTSYIIANIDLLNQALLSNSNNRVAIHLLRNNIKRNIKFILTSDTFNIKKKIVCLVIIISHKIYALKLKNSIK
jgi:glycosyltransferase involved in cell wall biosynthesis